MLWQFSSIRRRRSKCRSCGFCRTGRSLRLMPVFPPACLRSALTCRRLNSALGNTSQPPTTRSEEHTSELQSRGHLVCRLLLEKKKKTQFLLLFYKKKKKKKKKN